MYITKQEKKDHDLLVQTVRKNKDFHQTLNIVNEKLDEPLLTDDLDWLNLLLTSTYTFVYQTDDGYGIIGTHDIRTKYDLINDAEANDTIKVYWYSFPENKEIEEPYKELLKKVFNKSVEGVQIHGSSYPDKPTEKTTSTDRPTNGRKSKLAPADCIPVSSTDLVS